MFILPTLKGLAGGSLVSKTFNVAALDLNFSSTKSLVDRVSGQNLITFARSSGGTYVDSTGTLQTASNDVPRFDHNLTTLESLGLLVEEQRTNSIRNNTMVGAVAGTPGTAPTNWTANAATNLTREVVGTGTENGVNYIDLRFTGTVVAARTQYIFFEPSNQIAASNGQSWTGSVWLKVAGGSLANIASVAIQADTRDSSIVYVNTPYSQTVSLTSSFVRYSASGSAVGASVAWIQPFVQFTTAASGAIDITLRIGLPQLEQGAFATSVIPTTTAAATRSADVASITGTNFSSWYNQSEGTMFADAVSYMGAAAVSRGVVSIDGATPNDVHRLFRQSDLQPVMQTLVSGVAQATFGFGAIWSTSTPQKMAYAYAANNFAGTVNNATVQTDSSGTIPTTGTLNIGNLSTGNHFGGTIRRLVYWGQRLPNNVLQSITQ